MSMNRRSDGWRENIRSERKVDMMFLNSEELMNIAFDEIEAAVNNMDEDYEIIVNRVRGVVGFVHRMRDKKEAEKA